MERHFLQSKAWQKFQTALGRQTFEAHGPGWHYLAILETGRFSRLYCPYGPTADSLESLIEALAALNQQAESLGVHCLRVEPQAPVTAAELRQLGAHRADHDVQPARTWRVDLRQSQTELLADFTSNNRRYWLNYKDAAGLGFRVSHDPADLALFLRPLHEVASRTGMRPHSDHYFKRQASSLLPGRHASLILADVKGEPAAAILAYDSPTTRLYAHAAAHSAHTGNRVQANTGAVIFAMLDAKAAGKQWFDFYGVAPQGAPASHPWTGFTKYKQSFGGEAVDYLGSWDIPVRHNWYRLYKTAGRALHARHSVVRQLKRLRRKLKR